MSTDRHTTDVRFVGLSLDCPDPGQLADFYLRLLGGMLLWRSAESAGVKAPGVVLAMQRVPNHQPPKWPGTSIVHIDLSAGAELDEPEARAVALGATVAELQPDSRWRVLLDPAGHPFCITTVVPPQRPTSRIRD